METTFARWLRWRKEPAYAYALRAGLPQKTIYTLAGVGISRPVKRLDPEILAAVSADTGISEAKLWQEAVAARNTPTPPRKYVKKESAKCGRINR